MSIHIQEVSPILDTILRQQQDISARLGQLIEIFKRAPAPVEPVLRSMLKPLRDGMTQMQDSLERNSSRPKN